MKARAHRRSGRPALELLEEAVVLLRRTPLPIYLAYYVGAVPFCLAALYFVADMSRSAFAGERLGGSSLLLAVLYLWMKCWHAVAARHWRALLGGEAVEPWSGARLFRLVTSQAMLQASGLIVRPLAYIATLPAVWVAVFYQNATVLGDLTVKEGTSLRARAGAQARLWPGQSHTLFALFTVFVFFVWLNVALLLAALPELLKMLTGLETTATRSGTNWILNGTFPSVTVVLTFLCVDPIWKALFVLRCFYGESLQTGADLQARLSSLRAPATAAALLAALLLSLQPPTARADESPAPTRAATPEQVDEKIQHVLQRREYAWRLPRQEDSAKEESTWLNGLLKPFRSLGQWAKRMAKAIVKWLDHFFNGSHSTAGDGRGLSQMKPIVYALLGALLLVLAWTGWRAWGRRHRHVSVAQPVAATPDLHSDDVVADQLPEEGWLRLMREMIERGELRLALRAAYLGGLAHLGKRDLLAIARHKTNRDYERELGRRARSREELLAAFGENLRAFERAWYGRAAVSADVVSRFTDNLEKIRAC